MKQHAGPSCDEHLLVYEISFVPIRSTDQSDAFTQPNSDSTVNTSPQITHISGLRLLQPQQNSATCITGRPLCFQITDHEMSHTVDSEQAAMAEALSYRSLGAATRNPFVLSLDVGTTTMRCHVYDKRARIVGSGFKKVRETHSFQWTGVKIP